ELGFGQDKDPQPGAGSGSAQPPAQAPKQTPPANQPPANQPPAKKAGVDTFSVTWKKEPASGATTAQFRIDFRATFKNDATHDPALADFRQNAFHHLEITAGPHKDLPVEDNGPLHDDGYSRADDVNSNPSNGTLFEGYDNPGTKIGSLDKDDVLNYSFTAEQMIIDTSDNNKVIAKKGPHTGTITGKDPRHCTGVPKSL
ncbi:MAG TPA: hypothetical protein VKJ47_23225, partial [Candidatus Binatia bacterium]|nr:hypothetical protein [Candidatus Binatia bacterium]